MADDIYDTTHPILKKLKKAREAIFLKHPREVGETYGEHFRFTMWVAFYLLVTAIACLLHGLFPVIFKKTTSKRVQTLYRDFEQRISHAPRTYE
jgi:Family of unknown function (DUF6356)